MSAAFGETLRYITTVKLQELERQRVFCRACVDSALQAAARAHRPLDRVKVLLQRIRAWKGIDALVSPDLSLANYESWVEQAEKDASIPTETITGWATSLEKQLRQTVARYDHARLFGDLLEEWLKSGDSSTRPTRDAGPESSSGQNAYLERRKQQERIEEFIFTPKSINTDALQSYLERLFAGEDCSRTLALLRRRVREAGDTIRVQQVEPDELRLIMRSLLRRDLMTPEKTATLKQFLRDDIVLQEIASVLSMQIAHLDDWNWPEEGVPIEMRRHLNGKYRAYMDCEIMQALLFHHIGVQWAST